MLLHVRVGHIPSDNGKQEANCRNVNYKTTVCHSWLLSHKCPYGNKCQFSHHAAPERPRPVPLLYKIDLCLNEHEKGVCPYGVRCNYRHASECLVVVNDHTFAFVDLLRGHIIVESIRQGRKRRPQLLSELLDAQFHLYGCAVPLQQPTTHCTVSK
jgi:hypothetical protein